MGLKSDFLYYWSTLFGVSMLSADNFLINFISFEFSHLLCSLSPLILQVSSVKDFSISSFVPYMSDRTIFRDVVTKIYDFFLFSSYSSVSSYASYHNFFHPTEASTTVYVFKNSFQLCEKCH